MIASIDIAIAVAFATVLATIIVNLPHSALTFFRSFTHKFFSAALVVINNLYGHRRDRLSTTTDREIFLFMWFIFFVLSLFVVAYAMRQLR